MKSETITKQLKDVLDVATNDEILPALETAMSAKAAPPLGATIVIAGGQLLSPAIFGLSNPAKLSEIETLQRAFRSLADVLDRDRAALIRAEVAAELKADAPANS